MSTSSRWSDSALFGIRGNAAGEGSASEDVENYASSRLVSASFRRLPERPTSQLSEPDGAEPKSTSLAARLSAAQGLLLSWLGVAAPAERSDQRRRSAPASMEFLRLPQGDGMGKDAGAQQHRYRAASWAEAAPAAPAPPSADDSFWQNPVVRRWGWRLAAAVLLGIAFYPRQPQWRVLDLELESMTIPALAGWSGIVDAFTGNSSAIQMSLLTTVQAFNPNLIGATALPGSFDIEYEDISIGQARTVEQAIGPLGSVVMKVKVKVDEVPGTLGMEMLHAMELDNMQLPIMVTGSVIGKIWAFEVLTKIRCDLHCDVRQLPRETRFSKKVCTYIYDLPEDED